MERIKITQPGAMKKFIDALNENKIIAYPTDTIYGLGTAIDNDCGIDKINVLKNRIQPMSIAISSYNIIKNRILINSTIEKKIIELIKDGSTCIADYYPESFNKKITKDGKIGFRIPNHKFLKDVLDNYNKPITTTSINKTGNSPLTSPEDIEEKFGNQIDLLIDDGVLNNSASKIFIINNDEIKQIR
jgi:L-threonylcarbamoyladenylate synthase